MIPPSSRSPVHLLAFGDSLTEGFGLPPGASFTAQLQRRLDDRGHQVHISNHGISGDTTAGGLARIESALQEKPDCVLLELGTNDALMGVPIPVIQDNLDSLIRICLNHSCRILLAGVDLSPVLGHEYGSLLSSVYAKLAERHSLSLHPDFLADVVGRPELTLMDGVHPSERGLAVMVETILDRVASLISGGHPD